MTRLASLALLAVLLLAVTPALASDWWVYRNARFGTTVDIPGGVFTAEPEADNGDGRRFRSADGAASITVYAGHNVEGLSLGDLVAASEADATGDRVTYRRKADRWFVLSGYRGEDVFYRKLLLSADGSVAHTLEIVYPAAEKRRYDPLVAGIANSLSAGD